MKIVIDKLPSGARTEDIINAFNIMADKLNMAMGEIDEENISDAVMAKINKEV